MGRGAEETGPQRVSAPKKSAAYAVGEAPPAAGAGAALERFEALMTILRARCPWDRAQSLESLQRYLIEESAELLEALDDGDPESHREELGDLLFQILFQSKLRQEEGAFTLRDVIEGIDRKLRRRHPELFVAGGEQVIDEGEDSTRTELPSAARGRRWEALKAAEKPARQSALDGVPKGLSPLTRALVLGERAARQGFDWPDWRGPMEKIEEERIELLEILRAKERVGEERDRAGGALPHHEPAQENDPAQDGLMHEAGDLLFSVVNLCRKLSLDPERVLRLANRRFEERFRTLEGELQAEGRPLSEQSEGELDRRWERAKLKLR